MFLAALGFASAVFSNQGPFWDTPKNHWAYEGIAYMKSQGLLVAYPEGLGHPRDVTKRSRYEFAVEYHICAGQLKSFAIGFRELSQKVSLDKPGSQEAKDDLDHFKEVSAFFHNPLLKRSLEFLERGGVEFDHELITFGARPHNIHDLIAYTRMAIFTTKLPEPGSALRQFSDVPSRHWAAKATLELRLAGIVQGDGDGAFRG